jgi:hypothetical protein
MPKPVATVVATTVVVAADQAVRGDLTVDRVVFGVVLTLTGAAVLRLYRTVQARRANVETEPA